MEDILVSVIIPVYNSEKTLPKCLDSLKAQTYKNIEVLCVNDCSKDNSEAVINKYVEEDARFKLITHKENKRTGGARNTGIRNAKGLYFCLLDNDDWLTPEAIESMVEGSEDGKYDIVVPQWVNYISESDQATMQNLIVGASKEENLKYLLLHGARSLGCLFKKSLIPDNDVFFPENTYWEDNPIVPTWFFLSNGIKVIPQVGYYYNNIPNSSSRQRSIKSQTDRMMTTDMFMENLKKRGYYEEYKDYIDYRFLSLSTFTIQMFAPVGHKEAKPYLKQIKEKTDACLPNRFFNRLSRKNRFVLKHPYLSCFVGKYLRELYWFVKKIK